MDILRIIEVAAVGRHHIMLRGREAQPELASLLVAIQPDLAPADMKIVAQVWEDSKLEPRREPWRPAVEKALQPAALTAAALVGGGAGIIRPGMAARAHGGVLYLQDAPELPAVLLDALRQPLESGYISIHRADAVAHFNTNFQLVLDSRPCPCGQYGEPGSTCECTPFARRRYAARIAGPVLDRLHMQVPLPQDLPLVGDGRRGLMKAAVQGARERTASRLRTTPWTVNAEVPGAYLRGVALRLPHQHTASIDRALERGGITMRGYDRVLRVAWSIADLAGHPVPSADDVEQALLLRRN